MVLFQYKSKYISVAHTITPQPDPSTFYMHAHDCMEIYMLIQGNVSFCIEGSEQPLYPYDIIITKEAETHKLIVDPTTPYERIWIQFHKEFIASIDPEFQLLKPFYDRPLGKRNHFRPNMKNDRFWFDCITKLCSQESSINQESIILSYLLPILADLNMIHKNNYTSDIAPSTNLSVKLVSYINEHLFEPINLDMLSKEFFISKSQLNRIFHRATGSTIARYVSIKRLLTARCQIRDGAPIHQVCHQCGYNDYSAFFRAYRNQFNVSPIDDKK